MLRQVCSGASVVRWISGLACSIVLGWAGCAPIVQERVHDLQQDGLLLYQRGNFTGARETFQTALAIQPSKAVLLYNVGQCSERLGDLAGAEKAYLECLHRLPSHVPSRHALITLKVEQGKPEEARQMVNDWLAREPKSASAKAADGWLMHQGGDLLRAKARLQEALESDPRELRALSELGQIYEKMGRSDRALALYERALEQDSNQADIAVRVKELKAQGVSRPRMD
jgi:Tfp pilus assembly protein PilF